ncbi:MAG TPA: SrfA family protein [Enterobacteriaceae bacterium]|nr:SrfA family protein [Enterobacteriaceae bacterium]
MAKTLLRSGELDDYQAVGGGGQAVFDSALQIREALRLRKQQAIVDCLAIPQVNDEGDRVDWYAPIPGTVTSWKAADEDTRFRALRYLESTLDSAASLSRKCIQSDKTAQQLFGSLLAKALQFPGENHVFLVDGKPVIAFWGFVNLNESAREDVLACLREIDIPEPIVIEEEPEIVEEEPVKVTLSQPDEPLISPPVSIAPVAEPTPPPAAPQPEPEVIAEPPAEPAPVVTPTPEKRTRRIPLWSLPLAAVVVAAAAAPLLWNTSSPSAESAPVAQAPVEMKEMIADVATTPPLPQLTAVLPLHQAEFVAPPKKEEPKKEEPVEIAVIPKDALVMEANEMKAGTTRFLNGDWRVLIDVKDPVTGKAPALRYQIQNNKGTARLVQSSKVTCRADIYSGLHKTGELMIKSRSNARCTDGTRYPLPEITCKAGTHDVAECTARYDSQTVVPLTFKKTGA